MIIRGNTIGTNIKPEKNLVKATDLTPEEQKQARANIGVLSTLIVTVDENNTASHSAAQVYAHVQNGGDVLLDDNGFHVALSAAGDESIYFVHISEEHISTVYELWGNEIYKSEASGGSVDLSNYYTKNEIEERFYSINEIDDGFYTKGEVDSKIGDISSALAELHAYAETLKGGGAV